MGIRWRSPLDRVGIQPRLSLVDRDTERLGLLAKSMSVRQDWGWWLTVDYAKVMYALDETAELYDFTT